MAEQPAFNRKIEMLVAPLAEQCRIVAKLAALSIRSNRAHAELDRVSGLAQARSAAALLDRLDQAILAKAFRGELVPQDPNDEPASALLERIRAARSAEGKPVTRRRHPPRMSSGASR
jgi:type I restriction enzyme S subunit